MKQIGIIAMAITLILTSQLVAAASITDVYTAGNPVTVTTMDNIKSAVNDNDTRVGDNATAIGDNATDIGDNATAIGGNTGNITTNTGNITTNTSDITSNASDITTNASDIGTNAVNIGINSSAVTDHGTRIIDLESASPAVGRIALTATLSGVVSGNLVDAATTTVTSTMFPEPSDYVSGTITLKALVSGCSGNNVRLSISRTGVNVGVNSLLFIAPPLQTVFIPTAPIFQFQVVEVATTATSFFDLNSVSLNRFGADALDTCASALSVRGFIVEYPRG